MAGAMEPPPVLEYHSPHELVKERRKRMAQDRLTAAFGWFFYAVLSFFFWVAFIFHLCRPNVDPSIALTTASLGAMTTCASAYCGYVWHRGRSD
jgi:hypothetical protein